MAKRVCRRCPQLVPAGTYRGLCPDCLAEYYRERGTKAERGYGADHQALRKQYRDRIRAGEVIRCVSCDEPVGLDFHLGHNADRTGHIGPQCGFCNDSEAGKAAHRTLP